MLSSFLRLRSFPFFSIKAFLFFISLSSAYSQNNETIKRQNSLLKDSDSVVGIATRLMAGWSGGSNPAKDKVLFPSKNSKPCLGTTQPHTNLYLGSFPPVKRPELDADHSSHELPRLGMSGYISLLPTMYLYSVDKEKVHFSFSSWLIIAPLEFWDLLV